MGRTKQIGPWTFPDDCDLDIGLVDVGYVAAEIGRMLVDDLHLIGHNGHVFLSDETFVCTAHSYRTHFYRNWKLYRTPDLAVHPDDVTGPYVWVGHFGDATSLPDDATLLHRLSSFLLDPDNRML
jgi:hypothetical protein